MSRHSPKRSADPRVGAATVRLTIIVLLVLVATPGLAQEPRQPDPAGPPTLEQLLRLEGVEPRMLDLDEALALALDGNRDLREARLNLEEAEAQVTEAWGNVYPRIDLNASWTRNISPPVSFLPEIFFDPDADEDSLIPVAFGLDNQWSSTISLEQPLFEAGAFIGVGAAGRYRALQDEQVRGRMHQVVTQVRRSYYQLLLAEEQARLISRSVERVVESLEETRALNRAGLASDYDVLRLEVELANLEPRLRRAANEALRVEREMVTELNLPDGTRLRVQGALAQMELDDPAANTPANRAILSRVGVESVPDTEGDAFQALLQQARTSSSALQQSDLNMELRHAELRAEQAEFLPRVSLFANYQVQAQQEGSPNFFGESRQRGYGRFAGIQVSLPVFSGRQRLARVDQRQAAVRAARLQTELATDRLRDDLRTVLDEVEEARLRARGQRLAVGQATRGYEIAAAEYREGLVSQLELTDAEVALRESEFNYAEAVYDYLEARARLDELVGRVPVPSR
jgi:outer membrane protein